MWGPPGVGKTEWALRTFGDSLYKMPLPKSGDLDRWPGYDQNKHAAVFLDEFKGQIDVDTLNGWINKYPFWARDMGCYREIRPRVFVFTSQDPPERWWGGKHAADDYGLAFKRRCNENGSCVREFRAGSFDDANAFAAYYASLQPPGDSTVQHVDIRQAGGGPPGAPVDSQSLDSLDDLDNVDDIVAAMM